MAGADRLELLQTFVRIVEAGSLSAAAARMGTTQPTVSRRLQLLERSFGLRLLQRSTHAMKLTEDGERCYEHARHLLDSWRAAEADLRGEPDTPRGRLRVVVPHAFGQEQLIAPLAGFLRRHPGVEVEWMLHDRLPDFLGDGVDCAIRVGHVHEADLVAVRLAEVPRIVVGAPTLWPEGASAPAVAGLDALPWLALTTFYRDTVLLTEPATGEEHRFAIRPRLSTDSLYALRNAALAGLGAALVSAWVVAEDIAAGRLLALAPGWEATPQPVHLVYPGARFHPPRLTRFIEHMREHMPRMPGVRPPSRASALPSGDGPAPPRRRRA